MDIKENTELWEFVLSVGFLSDFEEIIGTISGRFYMD